MSKLKAVEEIRKLGRSFVGVLALCDELERVGSIENAASEAEARFAKAQADERQAVKDLSEAKAEIDQAKTKASVILDNARTLAEQTVELSKGEAGQVIEKAKAEADRLVSEAKRVKADIDALAIKRQNESNTLAGIIEERTEKLAELDKQLAALRSKLL